MLVKRLGSTIMFAGILLLLGAAAFVAWPADGGRLLASDPLADAGAASQLVEAQAAATKYNAIAMSLDATSTITNAQALADAIAGSTSILRWNPATQSFEFWIPSAQLGNNFSTTVGTPYFVEVDNTNPGTFTLVGDVPPQSGQPGAVQFSLVGGASCQYNFITLPLDFGATVTKASELATAVGDVESLLRWNSTTQSFEFYIVGPQIGTDFPVSAGYPYWLCMNQAKTWPTTAP